MSGIVVVVPALPAFSAAFSAYVAASKKLPAEIVARKGVDLRIQVFRGMKRQEWKRGRKGGAWREQQRRFKAGKGVKVRDRFGGDEGQDKNGKKLTRWQRAVKHEIDRRARGVGLIGVTFLDRRWRKPKKGHYLSRNTSRSLGTLAITQQTATEYRLTASTPGVDIVSNRYGVLNRALETVTADMNKYLTRKANEAAKATLARYAS